MGGELDTRTYREGDRKTVEGLFRKAQTESCRESGMSYSGEIGVMPPGIARWHDLRFPSEEEARDYLSEHHHKWNPAEAVSFLLPEVPGTEQKAAREEAARAYRDAEKELEEGRRVVLEALRRGEGARGKRAQQFVECRACGSSLNRQRLQVRKCPLCGGDLLSEVQRGFLGALEDKQRGASAALEKASAPVPSKKVGWVVGGWCSS